MTSECSSSTGSASDGETRARGVGLGLESVLHFLHGRFLWLLLGSYAVAAIAPGPGLKIRDVSFGELALIDGRMNVSLPAVMLGMLLLNAGLGVRATELRRLLRNPLTLGVGLAANLLVPIAFIFGAWLARGVWHNPHEVQNILVGLALVAAMPIAGSSTAWSQNADGDLALSLGLVVCSTLFSPFTTPLALHAVGGLAAGGYASRLHDLAAHGTSGFLAACVVFPSVLGMILNHLLGHRLVHALRPWLKLANQVNLLVLCYSNAALSLPQTIAQPDPDFLAIIIALTAGLCLLAFGMGWGLGRLLRLDAGARISLMFGLGMNNNGTGLVLASLAFADSPRVLLPIILYNLVQQIVAGAAISSPWAGRGSARTGRAKLTTVSARERDGLDGNRRVENRQPNRVAGWLAGTLRPVLGWPG